MHRLLLLCLLLAAGIAGAADEQPTGLLFIEAAHDLGYTEMFAQIRSVEDPERFYKISMMKGHHHNPIPVPPGKYYFEAMKGPGTLVALKPLRAP